MAELKYPLEEEAGKLTLSDLKGLDRDNEEMDNVTFYKRGGVRKYALTRFPKPGQSMGADRIEMIYKRWLKLVELNKYVALKQFHGVIKANTGESAFLVTDYFPGGSLADTSVISSLSATESMIIIVGVLGQLAMLHNKGMFHRALSPTRIVLDEKKHPHIVGWSRVGEQSGKDDEDGSNRSGVTYGDFRACFIPLEMGPQSGPLHYGVDIWSFAMVCLWLIDCKNRYFGLGSGSSAGTLVNAKQNASELPANFGTNNDFQDLLSWCLTPDYEQRPTAGQVLSRILEEGTGLNNTNWERVQAYASENICSEGVDDPETLESFFEGGDEEEEEEEEDAKEE